MGSGRARTLTVEDGKTSGRKQELFEREPAEFRNSLVGLESVVAGACKVPAEWPAQIAAGVCAGVDYAIANPAVVKALVIDAASEGSYASRHELLVGRLAGLLRAKAPPEARLPVSTDEALVAGIVGLVGDHIRIGRPDRLAELRPELVLLTLLPYLGFAEAQRWANRVAGSNRAGID